MTTYFTDAFAGSNNASWNASNWTTLNATSGATATIQSNKGRCNAGTSTGYSGKMAVRYAGTNRADYEISGTLTINSATDGAFEVWIRASTTAFDGTGYFLHIDANGGNDVSINKAVSYSYTTLQNTSLSIATSTAYKFKFYVVGTTVKAKVWAASGSEPGSYTLSATDSSVGASGYVYVASVGGSGASYNFDVDDVTLTDGTGNSFTFTASSTSSSVLKRNITKNAFTGSTTATSVLTSLKVVVKAFTASITPAGAWIKVLNKAFTGSSTMVGLSFKQMFRTFAVSSTSTGAFRKSSVRLLTATVTTSGTFTSTFLGRVFGRPGRAAVQALRAAEAIVRIRRT
jgi:hypothetical protein